MKRIRKWLVVHIRAEGPPLAVLAATALLVLVLSGHGELRLGAARLADVALELGRALFGL